MSLLLLFQQVVSGTAQPTYTLPIVTYSAESQTTDTYSAEYQATTTYNAEWNSTTTYSTEWD